MRNIAKKGWKEQWIEKNKTCPILEFLGQMKFFTHVERARLIIKVDK